MSYKIISKVNIPIAPELFIFNRTGRNYEVAAKILPSITNGIFDSIGTAEDSLLTSPSVILAEYIRQELIMTDPADNTDWPLYISYFPDVKTEMGAIYDTSGIKLGRLMEGSVIQEYGIQIKISSDVFNDAWEKLEALVSNLDSIMDEEIIVDGEDYVIHFVSRNGPPVYIGVEDGTKKRKLFVINCLVNICRY